MRYARLYLGIVALVLTVSAVDAPASEADQQLAPGSVSLEVLDRNGNLDNRAGVHPDRFAIKLVTPEGGVAGLRESVIDFAPGLAGDVKSVPACPRAKFDSIAAFSPSGCEPSSQVGQLTFRRVSGGLQTLPIYSLEPAPGETAAFGADVLGISFLKFSAHARADSGLTVRFIGSPQFPGESTTSDSQTAETQIEFWGIPADHQEGTSIPRRPFLTTPTRCDNGPITAAVKLLLWQRADPFTGTASTGAPLQGCGDLPFAPKVSLKLEKPAADSPTGVDLDMSFPQSTDPDGLASSQARSAAIELPAGMALSAAAASGLVACSDEQLGLGSEAEARCPAASKVGSVEIGAPQLGAPLDGKVYFGQGHPGDRFRLFLAASGSGVDVKLVGSMRPDPVTGRLTAVLNDLPQISFAHLLMHFDGGPRALFQSPLSCGPATADATITPYSGTAAAKVSASDTVTAPPSGKCGAFDPSLEASASTSRPGRPTSFATVISRRQGEQAAERFSISLPLGFSARLGSVGLCPAAAAAAGSCPDSSRIGEAIAAIGSGPEATQLDGGAFLTGPYRGAPFGFALAFRAALGPFDFGSLAVRGALRLDPESGQVTVRSDPLPQSFEGIPIRFGELGLDIDRPGFLHTPTSCGPKVITATVLSSAKAVANPQAEVAMRGCIDLPFQPRFSLALTGPSSQLRRHGKPGLRIEMRGRKQDANLRSMDLSMPSALRFDGGSLRQLCSRRAAGQGECPKASRVGTATARSPLIGEPLKGSVYVVQPKGDGQPDLWTSIDARGVELNLKSESSFVDGRLVTHFHGLPDMPFLGLTMRLAGGKNGVFSLAGGLCHDGRARRLTAPVSLEGQNAALRHSRVRVAVPGSCNAG